MSALVALVMAACRVQVEPRDPSIFGVVASREFVAGSTLHVVLKSGQALDVDTSGRMRNLYGGMPDVGDLLFYGESPESWFVALDPRGSTFLVRSRQDDDSDGAITLDFGLRLPLGPTYRAIGGQFEPDAPVRYTINENGQVIKQET